MMDWNDYIENEGELTTLPKGDYEFTVTSFEKGQHAGSAKIPPCNMAILELTFRAPDGARSKCKDFLLLHDSVEWKLCAFFRSIGQKQHGTGIKMDWNRVPGAKGRAHLTVNEWEGNDGEPKKNNRVSRFLDPEVELGGEQEW
mgnify:CR=1 FL=1